MSLENSFIFLEIQIIFLSRILCNWIFYSGRVGMVSIILKEDHAHEPVPTIGAHSCPTWEYPSKLWSWDLREHLCPAALYWPTDHRCEHGWSATGQNWAPGKVWTCSVWRIKRLLQLYKVYHSSTYVMCCPTFFCGACDETSFAFPLCCVSPWSRGQISGG